MVDEPPEKHNQESRDSLLDITPVLDVVKNSKPVTESSRRLAASAMLSTCTVMVAALLTFAKLDEPLTIAIVAFGSAIPLLGIDIVVTSFKFAPTTNLLISIEIDALQATTYVVCEGIGVTVFVFGLGAVLWHLSHVAIFVGVGAVAAWFVAFMVLGVVLLFRHAKKSQAHPQPKERLAGPTNQ